MLQALQQLGGDFWSVLAAMAPYLLFGFAVAGALHVLIPTALVERHLGGGGMAPVVKAALVGIPLPLCSCGVIPVAASLRRSGASAAATSSFLIATPQTGVDSIFVTYSLLGGVFAIFRPLAALASGMLGGAAVAGLGGNQPGPQNNPAGSAAGPDGSAGGIGRVIEAIRYGFWRLPADIGRSLLIGVLIASLITAVLPPELFAGVFGKGFPAMLAMLALGIPVYVCATASVPVAAALILTQGVSPGAALVFLMTGPATNLATIVTIWRIMGRRTAVIYLAAVMLTALASGLALDALASSVNVLPGAHDHGMAGGLSWASHASAMVLLAVLLSPLVGGRFQRGLGRSAEPLGGSESDTVVLRVEGMTCGHCAASVERSLGACEGVASAAVDLAAGRALVRGRDLAPEVLCAAVRRAGYTASAET